MEKQYMPRYMQFLWSSDAVRHTTSYFYLQKPLLAFWYDPSLKTTRALIFLYYLGMVEEDNCIFFLIFKKGEAMVKTSNVKCQP